MSETNSLTPSHSYSVLTGRLAISTIYPLFVEQFGRSLWFCHLEYDKKAIYDGQMSKKAELL